MDDWTPHRRDDGELLGWIRPAGSDWTAVDILGRTVSDAVDWLVAEEALEAHGLAWLAEPWMLEDAGRPTRVRIVEVTPDHDGIPGRIVVKAEDYGDLTRPASEPIELSWPLPHRLRPPQPGDPDGFTF
ncbi:hypothetical protein [Microbacterium abyssi]|uniref:hypothetical protein n=1 Tax=Microbacterium abyssi TaxID=2782166 RepID=UPI0018881502|nr:hypothetical protein [Microbacterium sp. A18JL241]